MLNDIAKLIDHTILKPDANTEVIATLCEEALEYKFCSVCVNSCWVSTCSKILSDSSVKTCSVVGFPLGAMTTAAKEYETKCAIDAGADEIDMVINIGYVKSNQLAKAAKDIAVITSACSANITSKVIIETCLLTQSEKEEIIKIAIDEGADFVKTSTGFSTGGATVEDIALMRKLVGPEKGVKASGGVRSYADAMNMINAGASRIGTSSGIKIVQTALDQ